MQCPLQGAPASEPCVHLAGLLCAVQSRWHRSSVGRILLWLLCRREVTIHMDRQCRGRPIARLDCSVLQMRYRVAPTAGCALPFVHMLTRAEGLQKRPSLAGIPLPRMLSCSRSHSSPCPGERALLQLKEPCRFAVSDQRTLGRANVKYSGSRALLNACINPDVMSCVAPLPASCFCLRAQDDSQ
jgi:hypothetical protein